MSAEVAALRAGDARVGAVCAFVGTVRDRHPAELAATGAPRLPETLERIEAEHTPDVPAIPDFSEPTPPAPAGPGLLIDPTNLDFFSTEELGAELEYQRQRAKTGR